MSYKDLIKYMCSKLEITLTVYNKNIPKKRYESSLSNFYRIKGNKYLKLTFFKKNYDFKTKKYNYENIKYITTLILSQDISFPKVLNYDNEKLIKDNIELFFNLEYFENYYTNFNEMYMLFDYLQNNEDNYIFNEEFFDIIIKLRTAYYFNTNNYEYLFINTIMFLR